MPNGGSDCCGTCWFNRKNRGERDWHKHVDNTLPIDTAPQVAGAATQAADFGLVPCRPGLLDLAAISGSVAIAQESNTPVACLLNAAPIRSPPIGQAQAALIDAGVVVAPVVHQRVGHAYAIAEGLAALEREPSSKAATEIQALWQWLYKRLQPKRRKR